MSNLKNYIKKSKLLSKLLLFIHNTRPDPVPSIKGIGNVFENKGELKNVIINIDGNDNFVSIGQHSQICNTLIYMKGNNQQLIIEDHCFMGNGALWIEDNHCALIIRTATTIEDAHLAVTENHSRLEIGEDCMLAKHIEIRTGDSHSIVDETTKERINKAHNVTIGKHVWIGTHAKILKGVTIESNSIVGTAALVTKNVAANTIVAGIPAVLVRTNVNWNRARM